MNPVVAQLVVQPKKNKPAAIVAGMVANNAKCSPQSAPPVERKPPYLSNHPITNRYIAVTATPHPNVAIGKSILNPYGKSVESDLCFIWFLHS